MYDHELVCMQTASVINRVVTAVVILYHALFYVSDCRTIFFAAERL